MLPRRFRLRHRAEFRAVLGGGRPAGRGLLVVHLLRTEAADPPRCGFVVTRRAGDAVTRNRLRRRLRHLVGQRLVRLPPGSRLVIRALPPAAAVSADRLAVDLDRALDRLLGPPGPPGGRPR